MENFYIDFDIILDECLEYLKPNKTYMSKNFNRISSRNRKSEELLSKIYRIKAGDKVTGVKGTDKKIIDLILPIISLQQANQMLTDRVSKNIAIEEFTRKVDRGMCLDSNLYSIC